VRVYTVQPGDTPASIAARDDMAGCPKCARDLVLVNPHRESVQHGNGYLAFRDPLVVGERLWLPDKWFDGTLDRLPPEYFASLPAGLGQLPPEHVPQRYVVQPGDSASAIAAKFGQSGAAASSALADANPSLPSVVQADGSRVPCSLAVGQVISLPDRWFAAGSSWSAVQPGCSASAEAATVSPAAAAQVASLAHPPAKEIALSIHPAALDKLQSASGGARDAVHAAGTVAAGTGAVVGTAVVGTFLAHLVTGVAYRHIADYVYDMF
jgi:LysM domain-containing protein